MVSKARDDLPEPDRPVNTTSLSRGISRSTFFRLCSRAPRMVIARNALAAWLRFALMTSSIIDSNAPGASNNARVPEGPDLAFKMVRWPCSEHRKNGWKFPVPMQNDHRFRREHRFHPAELRT